VKLQLKAFVSRIGSRIFLAFTVLLVAVTSLFGALGLNYAQENITANAANELRVLSYVLSRQVQRRLARIEDSMTTDGGMAALAAELRKKPGDKEPIEAFLTARLGTQSLLEDLAVFNRNGECIGATSPAWYDLADVRQRSFFTSGLKGFSFSEMFMSDEGKVQLVSAPIVAGTSVRGVLVGQVNLQTIYELMDQKVGVSESTDAFLVDKALRFITPGRTGIDKLAESHLVATPLLRRLKEEFWVDRYKNFQGQEVLGTVMRIPGRQWYVVVERDIAEVTRPVAEVKRAILVVSVTLIVALVLTTFLLTRSITRPLNMLVGEAQRLARGDFRTPVRVATGTEEIGFLADEFDKMRARIAAFQERLIERLEESERRRIESERLAAIGTLASQLAHEIRNPLNAMSLLMSRMELAPAGAQAQVRDTVTRELRGEIGRLDRLVSDILDYARPLKLELTTLDVRAFVEGALELYRSLCEQRGIALEAVLPATPLSLRGDADKLRQCLVNILQNAVDATSDQGGTIEVEARLDDGRILIVVRDDGVGLPQEAETHLFDLFFTTKEKGTGFGLSTVKKIVDAHGGQVSLARRTTPGSSSGRTGTEVVLAFPVSQF
jgi:signal transduction histidine kinase